MAQSPRRQRTKRLPWTSAEAWAVWWQQHRRQANPTGTGPEPVPHPPAGDILDMAGADILDMSGAAIQNMGNP